ncbi:MAG: ribosome biogenesis GTPase Der [Gammaproteobacteria bacterium]|nr:ribosome biogenesis GTPase Der [Gammaproteobacteria bacterium]
MQAVFALVGRPNVGKSTLFNRLTRTRNAIVADSPGLTRDRQYGEGRYHNQGFIVIDTGGIIGFEAGVDAAMASQSLLAIEEATLCWLLVDARDGLVPDDSKILEQLRKSGKDFVVIVNKVDGSDPEQACAEFYSLGVERVFPITATEGRGVKSLLESCLGSAGSEASAQQSSGGIKIAIAGRPNVGKSTLVNRILGEERVVVYDQPGTTRDSLYIPFRRQGKDYTLIDTAGIRRRGKTVETVEKFSIVKSLQAIRDSHVVLFLLDAHTGIVEQDLHLLGFVIETGRGLVIAINKWDGMKAGDRQEVRNEIRRRFSFVDFASIHFISARHGTGVGNLFPSINKAHESAIRDLSTSMLTQILEAAVTNHAPPVINGRRIKLRYAHAGGQNPPLIIIHGKQTQKLPAHYTRYLAKTFRTALQLEGTPVRIELKSDDNPFTHKEKSLSPRQVARKRRLARDRKAVNKRMR